MNPEFYPLEKRFSTDFNLKSKYIDFMNKYDFLKNAAHRNN